MLGVSRSGFYKWLNHIPSKRESENNMLKEEIINRHTDHKRRIGSIKMKRELVA